MSTAGIKRQAIEILAILLIALAIALIFNWLSPEGTVFFPEKTEQTERNDTKP